MFKLWCYNVLRGWTIIIFLLDWLYWFYLCIMLLHANHNGGTWKSQILFWGGSWCKKFENHCSLEYYKMNMDFIVQIIRSWKKSDKTSLSSLTVILFAFSFSLETSIWEAGDLSKGLSSLISLQSRRNNSDMKLAFGIFLHLPRCSQTAEHCFRNFPGKPCPKHTHMQLADDTLHMPIKTQLGIGCMSTTQHVR